MDPHGAVRGHERIQALLRLIGDRWADDEAESDWAGQVHLSRYHFQRVFLQHLGETPGDLRRRLRLERAAYELSATPQAVTTLALAAGFESLEGFSRAFRNAYGLSPSHYRRIPFPRFHLPGLSGIHYDRVARQPRQFAQQGGYAMDLMDRLIDHDVWLTRRMLERAGQLTDQQLDRPFDSGQDRLPFEAAEPTLRATLARLVETKEVWPLAVRGQLMPEGGDTSRAGLLRRLDAAFIEFAQVARQVREENHWGESFVDAACSPPESFTYGGMLAHVITFSAFRRGTALKMLEGLGANGLGFGDPIAWERSRV
ncbi:MAG: helix-turn-helix transcriptional regulator [Anaerolineales bacterium]|nr:helix-turn-helix transcriptional regulator [Anaerolineales bacterium]